MKKKDIKFLSNDKNMSDLFNHIFEESFGTPIPFDSAPALSDMNSNTWGYYSTSIYIKFNNGSGISIAGVAMS